MTINTNKILQAIEEYNKLADDAYKDGRSNDSHFFIGCACALKNLLNNMYT